MANFLDQYIHPETQRKIGYALLGIAALSHIWFLRPAFGFLNIGVIGYIDIGTIVGFVGAIIIWKIYKRQL